MNKKLILSDLKLKSFITALDKEDELTIAGGAGKRAKCTKEDVTSCGVYIPISKR